MARGARPAAGAGRLVAAVGPELAQLVVVGLWASTFIVTKAAFAEVTPMAFIFAHFALMPALAFAVLALRRRRPELLARRADLPRFVLAGLSGYTLYQLDFGLGLDRPSPFSSSLPYDPDGTYQGRHVGNAGGVADGRARPVDGPPRRALRSGRPDAPGRRPHRPPPGRAPW